MAQVLDRQFLQAEVIPRSLHTMSRDDISKSALKVLYRLHKSGHQAYLVGGSVRDILLGKHPKDFDVVTDAEPEKVRKIFSNSIIIGKRFRLVHVRYGHDIIEVATFRGEHTKESGKRHAETGMILRDNVYGELDEDVVRRDFTINALYYNIADFSVVDYVNGMEDLKSRTLRIIGDPVERYTEDPVRMLRAIRLAAKLGLSIEKESAKAIVAKRDLLNNVSSARLFDEVTKMSLCGHVKNVYQLLDEYRLAEILFPEPHKMGLNKPFVQIAFKQTDARIESGKTINPAFLMAVLFWLPLQARIEHHLSCGEKLYPAMAIAESDVLKELSPMSIPKRLMSIIRDIWRLQFYLTQTRRNRVYRSFYHPRFRAAYDFMLIRNEAGEDLDQLCAFWTEFQEVNQDDQERMIQQRQSAQRGHRRQKNKSRRRR